jgi:hypothetical protein
MLLEIWTGCCVVVVERYLAVDERDVKVSRVLVPDNLVTILRG